MADDDPSRVTVIELYKTAVEMADRVSARRGVANAFFLSIQTALVSIGALSFSNLRTPWLISLVLAFAGVAISIVWRLQLRSYRDLNRAKFAVINEIETRFPVRPFSDEWKVLSETREDSWWRRYADLGTSERTVPLVFALLHIATFAGRLTI
ncbi:hypothetical protein E0504_48120 [Parafrankia sp. BMG5.11]|nr:hypothetical protein E0504_48120 [Parafrankia sp. BMG5.11]